MQYAQLKEVIELDDQITHLHKELSDLYAQRAHYVDLSAIGQFTAITAPKAKQISNPWVVQTYAYLATAWLVHGIAIPHLDAIEPALLKARKVIDKLTAAEPQLTSQLGVLLVPPSSILPFPAAANLRQYQPHILLKDFVPAELAKTRHNKKNWQVLVAHLGPCGLDYGSAEIITKRKKFMIAHYDTRALGIRQYVALTLQVNRVIDDNLWTLLVGEALPGSGQVVSATFLQGQYRFELDEIISILGEERFRPAVEIKG